MLTSDASVLEAEFDACIVGAGPAGIACALDLAPRFKVLLLEAGGERPIPGKPDLLAAEILRPEHHDPTSVVAAHALGGSSHWWGGRCVPLDPADFAYWPISYEEIRPWYTRAAEFLGARCVHESPAPGAFARLSDFDATSDETWCRQINMSVRWRAALRAHDGPTVLLGARVAGLDVAERRVEGVRVRIGGDERTVRAKRFILSCGGLGGLKLLLLAQREALHLFGGPDGPLGRGYMGHLAGAVADIELDSSNCVAAFSTRGIGGNVRARRRVRPREDAIARAGIRNIAFWFENAPKENPEHGSPAASAKYLAARTPSVLAGRGGDKVPLGPHIDNIVRAPFSAAIGLAHAGYQQAVTRITGHMPHPPLRLPSSKNRWRLDYHAEQASDPENRVSLSTTRKDSTGLPALRIDFGFSDRDTESVLRAHEMLDADLRRTGAGRLHLAGSREKCLDVIKRCARDGYHQLGGAVMSADPARGVVDVNCRAHDLENLWVVSGSVFPSGGQANPTLTIAALARRLAGHLTDSSAAA